MHGTRGGSLITGKLGYAVCCAAAALALVLAGYAHLVVGAASGLANGIGINGAPSGGAMNILVMGLESRTDYQGDALSSQLLTAMHAGSVQSVRNHQVGGQDTNTLILVHIFAGGQKAVGFSIPRDDLVAFPRPYLGETQGKVDQAYGLAYEQSLEATVGSSVTREQRYLLANRAGQAAAVATVQSVTGVHVDHFIEVNLAGFFYLAQAFGGIEACVKSWDNGRNLHDFNSGFDSKRAGYLHLAADQALAYVRERDNLPHGDLDRTHRQQAVIDYVIWQAKNENIFSDIARLDALLGTARDYLVTDSGLNLLQFATNMRAFAGRNLRFATLPVSGQHNGVLLNGARQDVNFINATYIRKLVRDTFGPRRAGAPAPAQGAANESAPARPASPVTVDVYNGNGVQGLARRVSQALVAQGYRAGAAQNASLQSQPVGTGTQVFYGTGASGGAGRIAAGFGATAGALRSLPAGHVEVLLGTASTQVPAGLSSSAGAASGTGTAAAGGAASSAASAGPDDGQAGAAVTVEPAARYGIPCVY